MMILFQFKMFMPSQDCFLQCNLVGIICDRSHFCDTTNHFLIIVWSIIHSLSITALQVLKITKHHQILLKCFNCTISKYTPIVRLTQWVTVTIAQGILFWFLSFLVFFFTHFLNKIRYLLLVWKLVYRGAALYLQNISFTMDATFWRPKETRRKAELISLVNTGYSDTFFINVSPKELTQKHQFQHIHSTAFSTVLTPCNYSILLLPREENHTSDWALWNAS